MSDAYLPMAEEKIRLSKPPIGAIGVAVQEINEAALPLSCPGFDNAITNLICRHVRLDLIGMYERIQRREAHAQALPWI